MNDHDGEQLAALAITATALALLTLAIARRWITVAWPTPTTVATVAILTVLAAALWLAWRTRT